MKKEMSVNTWTDGINIDETPITLDIQYGIPIQFIKDKIKDCHYIAGNATPKVADSYNLRAKHLEDLIADWELFGKKWERGEKW